MLIVSQYLVFLSSLQSTAVQLGLQFSDCPAANGQEQKWPLKLLDQSF